MKKIRTIISIALCLLAVMAVAQDKPPITIPTYPGAQVMMEINMNNEDLATLLPMFISGAGDMVAGINEDDITDVLKNIIRVEYLQLESSKAGVDIAKLASFYNQKIPAGKWNKVFYMKSKNGQVISVFAQSDMAELYGYRMQTVKIDGKSVNKMDVARIEGKIDFQKLMKIAAPIIAKSQGAPAK
jgi:hypothetical protein